MAEMPLLSIIVTSYTTDRVSDILELLDSIKAQTYPNVETIFVAERSLELYQRIKDYAREKGIPNSKIIFNDGESGLSPARNLGVKHASGDIISFVDDDSLLSDNWAAEVVKTFQDSSIIGVTGPALPLWEDKSMSWFPAEFDWILSCTRWFNSDKVQEVRNVWGMNMAFSKEAFELGGLFQNNCGYHQGPMAEDNEFSLRVSVKTGRHLIYNPSVTLWHRVYKFRLSGRFVRERAYWIGHSRRMIKRLYPGASVGTDQLGQEHRLLKRIFTHLFPQIARGFLKHPVISWRQLSLTFTALFFVTLGYYSYLLPFTQGNKYANSEKKRLSDRFLNKLDKLAIKARPWIPFTTLNTIWNMTDKEAKTILDVGCGRGNPMKFINRQKRFYTVGVDIFEPYLKESKRLGAHDEYVRCDVLRLPFKERSFDIVLCMEVLEHFEEKEGERLLQVMEEHAKRQVILSTPVGKYKQEAYDGNPSQEHKHAWKPDQLKKRGYEVKVLGLRNLGGDEGMIARLPRVFKPLGSLLWVMAGPLVYFFPGLVGEVVCRKRLTHCDLAATSPGMMQACGKESRS